METIEYRTADKSSWGAGPWDGEPDKRQWPDPATGYPCLAVRNHMGAWCGYVGVSEAHPLFGKPYMHIHLHCHGGLTFSDACRPGETEQTGVCHLPAPGESDHVWWLGFDAGHCFDLVPGINATLSRLGIEFGHEGIYRDLAYITGSITDLAAQLKALELA